MFNVQHLHALDLESICLIPHIYIILCTVLLLTCSVSYLLILLWIYRTLNKISVSLSISIAEGNQNVLPLSTYGLCVV